MRITVDTNVIVSSTFWNGASDQIIDMVEEGILELVLSKDIFQEYCEVLNYEEIQEKIKNKNLEMKRTAEKIVSISTLVIPKRRFDIVKEDFDDNKILECAIEGNVDYVITQDNHLLKLKEFKGIKIITPKEFLKIFNEPKLRKDYIKKLKKLDKEKGINFKDVKGLRKQISKNV